MTTIFGICTYVFGVRAYIFGVCTYIWFFKEFTGWLIDWRICALVSVFCGDDFCNANMSATQQEFSGKT